MKRAAMAGLAAGALAVTASSIALAPAANAGGGPRMYHTISSTHGFASMSNIVGCEQAEVYVSSSVGKYAAQPGPVNKQGLTAVFVRVTDVCGSSGGQSARVAAAAGGGGAVVFEADGQNGAALVVDPRLTRASVSTTMAAVDGSGQTVTLVLRATWTGTGALEHTANRTHVLYPGVGVVSSNANDLRRAATAHVTVTVAGRTFSGSTDDALIEQSKSHCIEVPRPGVDGFFPCFGIPG